MVTVYSKGFFYAGVIQTEKGMDFTAALTRNILRILLKKALEGSPITDVGEICHLLNEQKDFCLDTFTYERDYIPIYSATEFLVQKGFIARFSETPKNSFYILLPGQRYLAAYEKEVEEFEAYSDKSISKNQKLVALILSTLMYQKGPGNFTTDIYTPENIQMLLNETEQGKEFGQLLIANGLELLCQTGIVHKMLSPNNVARYIPDVSLAPPPDTLKQFETLLCIDNIRYPEHMKLPTPPEPFPLIPESKKEKKTTLQVRSRVVPASMTSLNETRIPEMDYLVLEFLYDSMMAMLDSHDDIDDEYAILTSNVFSMMKYLCHKQNRLLPKRRTIVKILHQFENTSLVTSIIIGDAKKWKIANEGIKLYEAQKKLREQGITSDEEVPKTVPSVTPTETQPPPLELEQEKKEEKTTNISVSASPSPMDFCTPSSETPTPMVFDTSALLPSISSMLQKRKTPSQTNPNQVQPWREALRTEILEVLQEVSKELKQKEEKEDIEDFLNHIHVYGASRISLRESKRRQEEEKEKQKKLQESLQALKKQDEILETMNLEVQGRNKKLLIVDLSHENYKKVCEVAKTWPGCVYGYYPNNYSLKELKEQPDGLHLVRQLNMEMGNYSVAFNIQAFLFRVIFQKENVPTSVFIVCTVKDLDNMTQYMTQERGIFAKRLKNIDEIHQFRNYIFN